jgi:hypothetical protein
MLYSNMSLCAVLYSTHDASMVHVYAVYCTDVACMIA